jgi:hypothetical protein
MFSAPHNLVLDDGTPTKSIEDILSEKFDRACRPALSAPK